MSQLSMDVSHVTAHLSALSELITDGPHESTIISHDSQQYHHVDDDLGRDEHKKVTNRGCEEGSTDRFDMPEASEQFIKVLEKLQIQANLMPRRYALFPGDHSFSDMESTLNEVKALIHQGVEVNTPIPSGTAALLVVVKALRWADASRHGKCARICLEIIIQLVEHRSEVNVQDQDGRTPLLLTSELGWPWLVCGREKLDMEFIIVEELVTAGARIDPDEEDSTWPTTPLIGAVLRGKAEIVQFFLSKGANVNAQFKNKTPISAVFVGGYIPSRSSPIMSALLAHGADLKASEQEILAEAISNSPYSVLPVVEFLTEFYGNLQPEPWPNEEQDMVSDFSAAEYGYKAETERPDTSYKSCEENSRPKPEACKPFLKWLFLKRLDSLMFLRGHIRHSVPRDERLCRTCLAYEEGALHRQWFPHSPDSDAVQRSVLHGCPMCQLIKDCLPESFGSVSLYYFSTLSESDTLAKNYNERILVRGQVSQDSNKFTFGELRLAAVDSETASTLTRAVGYEDRETNSNSSLQFVAHWMSTCLNQHSTCQASRDPLPALPTRVIDVNLADATGDPHLFVSNGQQGLYATLSYCWGYTHNLRTESRTLESFQKSIPFQSIPKTIREAITVTRKLGIRYLWVDTLCILQDSTEDWLREAKNIANVYKNSVLTIAAADSEDSEGGLFRQRVRSRTRPVTFSPRIAPFPSSANSEVVFAFGDRQRSNDALRCESRLDRRGWVLQEQLLSPRILNYSFQELYWECTALLASESYPAGIPNDYDRNFERQYFTELKKLILGTHSKVDKDRVHMLWQHIIELYSKRGLSMETDKLVALAGAADQVSELLESRLLAGLWINWLWNDLLWWVNTGTGSSRSRSVRPEQFKAPSWSWASINGPISYKFPPGPSHRRYHSCIQILGHKDAVDIRSNSVSGYITVRGVTILHEQEETSPGAGDTWNRSIKALAVKLHDMPKDIPEELVWKPDTDEPISQPVTYLLVAACQDWAISLGLVLTPQGRHQYSRVGLAYWHPKYHKFRSGPQIQTITII